MHNESTQERLRQECITTMAASFTAQELGLEWMETAEQATQLGLHSQRDEAHAPIAEYFGTELEAMDQVEGTEPHQHLRQILARASYDLDRIISAHRRAQRS